MRRGSMMLASSNALKSSAMYIGYLILKEIRKRGAEKISIYDVSKALKKANLKRKFPKISTTDRREQEKRYEELFRELQGSGR